MRIPIILISVTLLASCKQLPDVPTIVSPYRIDIQQGNVVSQDMLDKLKPGMTRSQVRYVLGSPLVVDPFRTDRWDYVYMMQKQGKETERRNITVIFDGDKLLRIEGDVVPSPASGSSTRATRPAGAPPANSGSSGAAGSAGNSDSVKAPAAVTKPEASGGKPAEEKGFFGRMRDRLGF